MKNHEMQVLKKVAQKLNHAKISWALGGSAMLYLSGVVTDFHDLDFLIDERDAGKLIAILDKLGTPEETISNPQFLTHFFDKRQMEGISLDFIVGFRIRSDQGVKHIDFHRAKHRVYDLSGDRIYLDSLDHWVSYYRWMDKPSRVREIEQFLKKAGQ